MLSFYAVFPPSTSRSLFMIYYFGMLLFKKKFLEQIRRGEKTQTIRLWKYRRMKPGQRSYIPGVGYVSIDSVEPVELSRLTDADAVPDGFPTADLLRKEIRSMYPAKARKMLTPFRIRFSVYSPAVQDIMSKERQSQKQQQKHTFKKNKDALQREFVSQTLDKLQKMSESGRVKGET